MMLTSWEEASFIHSFNINNAEDWLDRENELEWIGQDDWHCLISCPFFLTPPPIFYSFFLSRTGRFYNHKNTRRLDTQRDLSWVPKFSFYKREKWLLASISWEGRWRVKRNGHYFLPSQIQFPVWRNEEDARTNSEKFFTEYTLGGNITLYHLVSLYLCFFSSSPVKKLLWPRLIWSAIFPFYFRSLHVCPFFICTMRHLNGCRVR